MRRLMLLAGLAVVCVASTACSRRLLGVLVDLPQGEVAPEQPGAARVGNVTDDLIATGLYLTPADTVTPEIELTLDPDSVVALLPKDHAGNIDWMAALRHEVIRPRYWIDGPRSVGPAMFAFDFDFYFEGPNEMFDAYFPHSAHTEWLNCSQCHPRIFKRRGNEFTMADVFAGKFCGECHGKVAYPVMTGCERCHTDLVQPPDRAQPELIGTVEMRRANEILAERRADSATAAQASGASVSASDTVVGDSIAAPTDSTETETPSTVEGIATSVRTDDFPRARFPHWVHRIRYRCKTCHMEIFEPVAGTNVVTMADIARGEACGQCHDARTAFAATIGTCERCHPPPELTADGSPDR